MGLWQEHDQRGSVDVRRGPLWGWWRGDGGGLRAHCGGKMCVTEKPMINQNGVTRLFFACVHLYSGLFLRVANAPPLSQLLPKCHAPTAISHVQSTQLVVYTNLHFIATQFFL